MVKIDWNKYESVFPDRYLRRTLFDNLKDRMVGEELNILDVGGGINGSLNQEQAENNGVWLLDPHVDRLPPSYAGKVAWRDHEFKYDLIIARGSFNYLTSSEIRIIPQLLREEGCFIFNTFLRPTEIYREYTKNGVLAGIEKTVVQKIDEYRTEVRHFLIPKNGNPVEHVFTHYSDALIRKSFFRGMNIQSKIIDNTIIYVIQNSGSFRLDDIDF